MKRIRFAAIVAFLGANLLFFQNCSKTQFGIDQAQKNAKLSNDNVFDDGQGTVIPIDEDEGGRTEIPVAPVENQCGTNDASYAVTMKTIGRENMKFMLKLTKRAESANENRNRQRNRDQDRDEDGNSNQKVVVSCDGADGYDEILGTKKLSAKNICAGKTLVDGEYQILVANGMTEDDETELLNEGNFVIVRNGVVDKFARQTKLQVRYKKMTEAEEERYHRLKSNPIPEGCDDKASPLVVRLNSNETSDVRLSNPLMGVLFDILGAFSLPNAHEKKLISWFKDSRSMMLVLPDKNGQVHGIDQLFGDQTRGPDGKRAANGFLALAKYDGMNAAGTERVGEVDGLITPEDEVYSHLRLWRDRNLDGVAESREFETLEENDIVTLDLGYDPNYLEVDKYGNEARYKSVVKTRDGDLHLFYDVWFRFLEPEMQRSQSNMRYARGR